MLIFLRANQGKGTADLHAVRRVVIYDRKWGLDWLATKHYSLFVQAFHAVQSVYIQRFKDLLAAVLAHVSFQ